MKILQVNLAPAYPIFFMEAILQADALFEFCQKRQEQLVIVTDSHLVNSYAMQVQKYLQEKNRACEILYFPAGESFKTRTTKATLEDQLFEKQYGRDTCLIAVGGGVVTDLTGFVAATYCRGISTIYIPTTLLAMVDASIGGKTGVNTPYGKNLIGAFYQPQAVFIDAAMLKTLSDAEYKNGIVETIKHALIADADLFQALTNQVDKIMARDSLLLNEIIYKSCDIKRQVVEQDEKDYGIRHLLNFGHTIGHAIEVLEDYHVSHGEAVAIGMVVESYLSVLMGYLPESVFEKVIAILKAYQLPLKTAALKELNVFKESLTLDKKAQAKKARFVLLDAIGVPHVEKGNYSIAVPDEKLDQALLWAQNYFCH